MTAAGVHGSPRRGGFARAQRSARARLIGLHLASRRVPVALVALVVCAVALRVGLPWIPRIGPGAQQLPLTIEAGAAAVIAATTRSPFGEPERATGRWLPYLRLATCATLTAATVAALTAGSASAHLADGTLGILRNVAGLAGIALLTAGLLGGTLAWVGPMAYLVVAEYALTAAWQTPWTWPARPPNDHGAAICAALIFAAGLAVVTVLGARDPASE